MAERDDRLGLGVGHLAGALDLAARELYGLLALAAELEGEASSRRLAPWQNAVRITSTASSRRPRRMSGRGVRLFGGEDAGRIELERICLGEAEQLTDLRFRVLKPQRNRSYRPDHDDRPDHRTNQR